jgi:DNA-binding MarR family transcriptional regulator
MTETRWLDEREAAAWRRMRQLGAPLNAALNRQLTRDSGLSMADYEVLVVLSEAPDLRLRARELGRATGWEKSRLSHHITRMERRGLVSREGCATDGRGAWVVMTAVGKDAIQTAAPGHVEAVRRFVIDALTPEQLEQLAAIGAAVQARLEPVCAEIEAESCEQ